MNDMAPIGQDFRVVGTRPVRPDGIDKVTGKAVFGPDFVTAGMLQGAVLRSPHAHARIRSIDTSRAEALPGVKAVVTAADFPDIAALEMAIGEGSGNIADLSRNCMARDKVLYEGHAVAAVAASSTHIARAALALIDVDYEVLPHVIALEDAIRPDAPVLHEGMFTAGVEPKPDKPSNLAMRFAMEHGDTAEALAGAAAVSIGRYTTPPVHQGYIEPHACVASVNPDGQAQLWVSSQGAFLIRTLAASVLDMPVADLRVYPLEIGGGFGGKTTIYLEPVALALSRKAGRPVRLAMDRGEVFRATGPAPGSIVDVRLGADADGRLVGLEMEFWSSAGAFAGASVPAAAMSGLGCYRWPALRAIGWDVVSNMPSSAAYRAPGGPPLAFAIESALDDIARQLGMDPIELRLRNAVRPGDASLMGTPHRSIALVESLEAARDHPHWSAPLGPNEGRGIAAGYWMNAGLTSTASVSVGDDGSVMVATGSPDIGGSRASMAMMAAEVLGLPYEQVRAIVADTASIGFSMVTGGSRTTFATGRAVIAAAESVVAQLRAQAAAVWGVAVDDVEWRDGAAHCSAAGETREPMGMRALAGAAGRSGAGTISAEISVNPHDQAPGFAVHICDCAVDLETGQIAITRYTAVQDVGRAIHPSYVEGQMQGGAVQGIGWALNEGYVHDAAGRLENAGFLDYRMPVASDLPMIDTVMIEVPNETHPFGVKGVGEVPIVPPLGAVANAVSAATGVRMHDLPLSPDRVFAAVLDTRG